MQREESTVFDVARRRRTVRRFTQERVPRSRLEELVDVARLAPSAANLQPLRYLIVDEAEPVAALCDAAHWAMYLEDGAPGSEARPAALILIFRDSRSKKTGYELVDVGLAAAHVILAAESVGLSSCILAALDRSRIEQLVGRREGVELVIAIALGHPAEQPVAVPVTGGSIRYRRTSEGTLHVPKRSLAEVLLDPPSP